MKKASVMDNFWLSTPTLGNSARQELRVILQKALPTCQAQDMLVPRSQETSGAPLDSFHAGQSRSVSNSGIESLLAAHGHASFELESVQPYTIKENPCITLSLKIN